MTQFQEELANALEALRGEREKNGKLESLNNHLQDELDRALHLLYLAENPQSVTAPEAIDADPSNIVSQNGVSDSVGFDTLPFTPDQE